jgi:hypothetical protein
MSSQLPPPTYYSGTFYSDCNTLDLGCCVRRWDPVLLKYVDADDGRGTQFSDGLFCYRIVNCVVVEKNLCEDVLYIRLCSDQYTDVSGRLNVYGWVTTGPDSGSAVGVNADIYVDFTVTFFTDPVTYATGTIRIGNFINNLPISIESLITSYPNTRVQSITLTTYTVYGQDPAYQSPMAGSFDPVPMVRTYYPGTECYYPINEGEEPPAPTPPSTLQIDQYTAINILYSMGTDGFTQYGEDIVEGRQMLQDLKDSTELKNCLLPLYGNDLNIYNYMVRVIDYKDLSYNFRQRPLVMLTWTNITGTIPPPPLQIPVTKKVVNILIQTEADDSYHSGCGRQPSYLQRTRKQLERWNQDLNALRGFLSTANATNPNYYRGILNVLKFYNPKNGGGGCFKFDDIIHNLMTGDRQVAEVVVVGGVQTIYYSWVPDVPGLQDEFTSIKYSSYEYERGLVKSDFVRIIADSLQALGYPRPCP